MSAGTAEPALQLGSSLCLVAVSDSRRIVLGFDIWLRGQSNLAFGCRPVLERGRQLERVELEVRRA